MRAILLLIVLVAGCGSPFGVRAIDDAEWFRRENRTALDAKKVSERTRQFLRRDDLLDRHKEAPADLIRDLDRRLVRTGQRPLSFVLSELAFLEASKAQDVKDATRQYLASAVYAYAYLFDEKLTPPVSEFDPTFRWASDFYNRGLAKAITYLAKDRQKRGKGSTWKLVCGDVEIVPARNELAWDPSEFDEVHVAYNFEVTGLAGLARSYGLGVPVVAVRAPKDIEERSKRERFLPRVRQSYAASVLLRVNGSITDRSGPRQLAAEIYDPLKTSRIKLHGRTVPLEADLTVPIAHMLNAAPDPGGIKAMRDVEKYPTALTMLQPYDPEKIPVVFTHGLMSSPLTWMPMFNDLLADPVLRERCQFWFFMYPTGNPVLYSAAQLRKALRAAQELYDPDGTSQTFNQMVLCGHSMGGLLSKTCVLTSGDRLWNKMAKRPLEETSLSAEDKAFMRELFFFERLPFVKRIVFMAVPHRGSKLATGFIGRIGASLVRLPARFKRISRELRKDLRDDTVAQDDKEFARAITGVGNLKPNNPTQMEIVTWKYPADVPVHSIIGDEDEAGRTGGSDGIVPYKSSHLDGVVSEKVVHSGHSVHWHQPAIIEIRRILLAHLGAEAGVVLSPPPTAVEMR